MAIRREVPSQFKAAKGRKIESTKALYDHSNKIILLTYSAGKKNLYIKISTRIQLTICAKSIASQ